MQFVTVFGVDYYIIDGIMPDFAIHEIAFLTGKFSNNLDTGPYWARYKANFILRKWGSLDA